MGAGMKRNSERMALPCDVRRRGLWYSEDVISDDIKARWVVDIKSNTVLECSESAAKLWGYLPREMMGMPVERLIAAEERERAREMRQEHLSGDAGTWKCVRKDGSIFYLHVTMRQGVWEGRLCSFAEAS